MTSRAAPLRILVYHPDEADRYAALVRLPGGRVRGRQAGDDPRDRDAAVVVHAAGKPQQAAGVIAEVDALWAWRFPPALYANARRLRWIQAMAAGVESVLVPELPRAVTVTRAPGIFGPWMTEYTLGWMLWRTQRMARYRDAQRAHQWLGDVIPERLAGKTLVVVGVGDIGRRIARGARALGMRVLGVSRSGRPVPGVAHVSRRSGLRAALGEADFVVLTVPVTRETRGLIGAAELAAMRPTAWLLNIARSAVIDPEALVTALRAGRLGGVVLDVFDEEPLPPDHPLWDVPNAVITPHIAGPSTPDEMAPIFNDNLARFVRGRPLRHVVDRRLGY